jgi:hypothetical protein
MTPVQIVNARDLMSAFVSGVCCCAFGGVTRRSHSALAGGGAACAESSDRPTSRYTVDGSCVAYAPTTIRMSAATRADADEPAHPARERPPALPRDEPPDADGSRRRRARPRSSRARTRRCRSTADPGDDARPGRRVERRRWSVAGVSHDSTMQADCLARRQPLSSRGAAQPRRGISCADLVAVTSDAQGPRSLADARDDIERTL